MLRLLILAGVVIVACRLLTGRYPWDYLRRPSARAQALDRARRLLGLAPGATRQDILDAHRRLVAMVHPDRGGTSQQVHEANAARDLLLSCLPDS